MERRRCPRSAGKSRNPINANFTTAGLWLASVTSTLHAVSLSVKSGEDGGFRAAQLILQSCLERNRVSGPTLALGAPVLGVEKVAVRRRAILGLYCDGET